MTHTLGQPTPTPEQTRYLYEKGANYLAGIFASLQVANTNHVTGYLSRVGGLTGRLRQYWCFQALEQVWVVHFEEGRIKKCDSDQARDQYFSVVHYVTPEAAIE